MSGGTFNYNQFLMTDMARTIQEYIDNNDSDCGWDEPWGRKYSPETIFKFKEAIKILEQAQIMVHRIDWLLAGDDGEEDFHQRWEKDLSVLK